jgi:hypothetical protein
MDIGQLLLYRPLNHCNAIVSARATNHEHLTAFEW